MKSISLDVVGFVGAALVVWGCYMIFQPSAFVVAGAFCLTLALAGAKKWQS